MGACPARFFCSVNFFYRHNRGIPFLAMLWYLYMPATHVRVNISTILRIDFQQQSYSEKFFRFFHNPILAQVRDLSY